MKKILAFANLKIILYILMIFLVILSVYVRVSWFTKKACVDGYIDLWKEPTKIIQGINPYERILSGDMIRNKKYPQMLPLAYLFPALFIKFGVNSPEINVLVFRIIMMITDLLIGLIIFIQGAKNNKRELGFLCAVIWLLCRWTLKMNYDVKPDNIAMLFAMLSLILLQSYPITACVLFGISLSFKHISIFLFPLFLYNVSGHKKLFTRIFYIFSIPLLVSTPFIIWNFGGFIKSMLFALTRSQGGDYYLNSVFGNYGIISRLPMFLVLIIFYILLIRYREKINIYMASFLVFLIYSSFTPLLYPLYFLWCIPFGLLFALQIQHN